MKQCRALDPHCNGHKLNFLGTVSREDTDTAPVLGVAVL